MKPAQKERKSRILQDVCVRSGIFSGMEIGAQAGQFRRTLVECDKRVAIFVIQAGQGLGQIADVGANAEVARPTDVDDDMLRHGGASGTPPT
jgi:hypothetical protein